MAFAMTVVVLLCSFVALAEGASPFWPEPVSSSLGNIQLSIASSFQFVQVQNVQSKILQQGMDRYRSIYDSYLGRGASAGDTAETNILQDCTIDVLSVLSGEEERATLDIGVDESYKLVISQSGSTWDCSITAATVWGALHSLETFTQLLVRTDDEAMVMNYAPLAVDDAPRFTHRGLLIDTSRHYLPVDTIKTMIDSLTLVKMNVLHWHMVDAESFPVDSPSSPDIVDGAYSPELIYTMQDIGEINDYATDRGVRIIYEIDGPGHAASWIPGYPELIPKGCIDKYSYNINDFALNPTMNKTYEVLQGILSDIVSASNTKYLHLGGDEVVYGCWGTDESIVKYMQDNDIATYEDLFGIYVEKAENIARELNTTSILWGDVFNDGIRPPKSTIFDVWTGSEQIANVTQAGYRVIAGPSNYWYLDHADNTWQVMYSYDPTDGLTQDQKELILGGEASMFGEMVDQYNIQPKVWPNTAAVAERLWSPEAADVNSLIPDATTRLQNWICLQNSRGFFAGPIAPGYCAKKFV